MGSTAAARKCASQTIEETAKRLAKCRRTRGAAYSRDFAGLLALLSPRIARLIRQYRLADMQQDAEQAAAIGVHRALLSYDPAKAQFSTHVTWQIRGELQSLRHRVRLDQRVSARNAGVSTVSLDAISAAGEDSLVFEVADDTSLPRTERGASDTMALSLMSRLLDRLDSPAEERIVMQEHLLGIKAMPAEPAHLTSEQRRQVVRRTMRNCIKLLAA
ncbi:MAG: hypothetical protein AAF250_06440 [Pseudomonadota bacterium]